MIIHMGQGCRSKPENTVWQVHATYSVAFYLFSYTAWQCIGLISDLATDIK